MPTNKYDSNFPIRKNNQFELLVNASTFYPAIIDTINQAKTEVIIENYLTTSGKIFSQFINALLQAAERNVKVYCLFDDFGSKGISRKDLSLLNTKNIHIQFYNRIKYQKYLNNLFRDHRKIYIIDRKKAFIGGAGLSDKFDCDNANAWHDIMVSIQGDVIEDWLILFQSNWIKYNKTSLKPITQLNDSTVENKHFSQQGQVIAFSTAHRHQLKKQLLNEINKSKKYIWLTTPYFVPSRKLRRSLIRAAQRGVDVKLLLPGKITDHPGVRIMGQRYYAQLLRHDVQIFEFTLHFSHAKVMLSDQWATTGSSNFDRWNFRWNLEANQAITDLEFSKILEQWFKQELKNCDEIIYQQWRNRSYWQRSKEWFWGGVVKILENLKRPSK